MPFTPTRHFKSRSLRGKKEPEFNAQYCDQCDNLIGFFAYSRKLSGPLTCGEDKCEESHKKKNEDPLYLSCF